MPTGNVHVVEEARADRYWRVLDVLREEAIASVYQPIVDLESGRTVAFEALSRFPGNEARGPDRWFADAWEFEVGVELELLAARLAARALPHLPPDVGLSINASPAAIFADQFLGQLSGRAHRFTIELTEHVRVEDYRDLRSRLEPLRRAGGKTAIDNFGSGFASLKHVVSVQPDWIKLDISVTERIDESEVAHALASALVAFAAEIGVRVIAEGIETVEELDALTEVGIRHGQGFYLGMPAPIKDALAEAGL